MAKPTKEEIAEQIKRLEEIKPKVRHFSIFHDDNRASIDTQVSVLKGEIDPDDAEGISQSAADEAAGWLETGKADDGSTDLAEGWKSLVQ